VQEDTVGIGDLSHAVNQKIRECDGGRASDLRASASPFKVTFPNVV
jgi:hypothetical protein